MSSITEEEKFLYKISSTIVYSGSLSEHLQILYKSVTNEKYYIGTTWLALKDFYYADQDLVVPKGAHFRWVVTVDGTVQIQNTK